MFHAHSTIIERTEWIKTIPHHFRITNKIIYSSRTDKSYYILLHPPQQFIILISYISTLASNHHDNIMVSSSLSIPLWPPQFPASNCSWMNSQMIWISLALTLSNYVLRRWTSNDRIPTRPTGPPVELDSFRPTDSPAVHCWPDTAAENEAWFDRLNTLSLYAKLLNLIVAGRCFASKLGVFVLSDQILFQFQLIA